MEQHPIPQQISSYQFRLVGDMTLKQFFQLAGGALISLLIYSTGLHPIIKWPLIVFFALFGAALAFLPFEERPLEQWIVAFFRSIYSPTLFQWRKTTTQPVYFQPEESQPQTIPEPVPKSAPSNGSLSPFISKLEEAEQGFLSSLGGLFTAPAPVVAPSATPASPPISSQPQELKIPSVQTIGVTPQGFKPTVVVEEKSVQPAPTTMHTVAVGQTISGHGPVATTLAQFSPDAAPPTPPTIPNVIVGQVMDPDNKIVEGAILEVRDTAGRPIRALKSNRAGHFMIVTPLSSGTYELITEKDGLMFEPLKFEATGVTIPPIAVRAKGREAKVETA